jgi:hypothetical protein
MAAEASIYRARRRGRLAPIVRRGTIRGGMRPHVCTNCGARLPVAPHGAVVRCAFCGAEERAEAPPAERLAPPTELPEARPRDGFASPGGASWRVILLAFLGPVALAVILGAILSYFLGTR